MDTVANMLSMIKNATAVNKDSVVIPHSSLNLCIAELLKDNNYLKEVRTFKVQGSKFKYLALDLIYDSAGAARISNICRISKPGQRIYLRKTEMKDVYNGLGLRVVSTSRGLMTAREAKMKNLGGEVLFEIW